MATLDLRNNAGTLRLSPNGGSASVRSFLVVGPAGPPGVAGAPGPAGPAGPAIASEQLAALTTTFTGMFPDRASLSAAAETPRPVRSKLTFPLGTTARQVLYTERNRVSATIVNTSASDVLKVGFGALDTTSAAATYQDVAAGQELPLPGALPVWAFYVSAAGNCTVAKEMTA